MYSQNCKFFHLWPQNLTYDFKLWPWHKQGQLNYSIIHRSFSVESYHLDTHTVHIQPTDECWSKADLSTKALWPHHWCFSQSTMATSARAHSIQDRRTDIQSSAWHSATVPQYLGPLDWVADLHGRRALRSASSSRLVVPIFRCLQSAVRHSTFLDLRSGMSCPKKLFRHRHFQVSGADLNPSSFSSHPDIVI